MTIKHEFIDTPEGVQTAYDALRACPYIFLDCEGRDLGTKDGALGLLQLGTLSATRIFLIDVTVLDDAVLAPIYSLLTDKRFTKVVWDGRMDDSELLFGKHVKMAGVLDLQIVDIVSRRKRLENEEYEYNRLYRMRRSFMPLSLIRKCQTEGLHVLNSMDNAVKEHGLEGVPKKDASVKSLHLAAQTCVWMARPLTSTLLDYAASDISRIAALYNHFINKGYIPNPSAMKGKAKQECIAELARICSQSQTYIMRHRMHGRPEGRNMYVSSEFLPLGVLSGTGPSAEGQARKCKACLRMLHISCFPFDESSATGVVVGKGYYKGDQNAPKTSRCRVCTFLDTRLAAKTRAQELAQTQTASAEPAAQSTKANGAAEPALCPPQHSPEKGQSARANTSPQAQSHSSQSLRSLSNLHSKIPTNGSQLTSSSPARARANVTSAIARPRSRSRCHSSQEKPIVTSKPTPELKRRRSKADIATASPSSKHINASQGSTPGPKETTVNRPIITPAKPLQPLIAQRATTGPIAATTHAAYAATDGARKLVDLALSTEMPKATSTLSGSTQTQDFDNLVNLYVRKIAPTVKA